MFIDPDIAKVLTKAKINPASATDIEIALADRMLQIYTTQDGKHRHDAAATALWRMLNRGTS